MNWIQTLVTKLIKLPFLSNQIGILIRHGMSLLGGYLLAIGVSEAVVTNFTGATTEVLMAVASFGLAWLFSTLNKVVSK